MASQDPILGDQVLGDQVLVAQQQFLVNESRHERQQPCPMESIAHGRTLTITTSGSTADPPAVARVFLPNGKSFSAGRAGTGDPQPWPTPHRLSRGISVNLPLFL